MSLRYQGGFLSSFYNPLEVPNPPTCAVASGGALNATVSFVAPSCVGGSAITGYGVISSPGDFTATGSASPITVTGLTGCTSYTFKVWAINSYGPSAYGDPSNSATPATPGQQAYTTAGTYSWVAPAGVTSVSVVTVGGGGGSGGSDVDLGMSSGAGGGALAYANNVTVIPGNSYCVVVGSNGSAGGSCGDGTAGGNSWFSTGVTYHARAKGGAYTNAGSSTAGSGGTVLNGTGSAGGTGAVNGGGGGAGGYSGNGGNGGGYNTAGSCGSGGGGGGGSGGTSSTSTYGGGGGGVGIFGQGSNGAGGTGSYRGQGGSCGLPTSTTCVNGVGGAYGGGGGRSRITGSGRAGAVGAVRIIWPGTSRSFPSTCTGDL